MRTFFRLLVFRPVLYSARFIRKNSTVASVVSEKDNIQLKQWKDIPGPRKWPIVGQIPSILKKPLSDISKFQENIHKIYGPIARIDSLMGKPPLLFLCDPEAVAFIYRSENWNPVRQGSNVYEYYRKVYKKPKDDIPNPAGLLLDQHDAWRHFRSTVNPVLMQRNTIELYKAKISEVADDMIKRMRSLRCEDYKIKGNFLTEMNLWSLESVGVTALETRLKLLDPNVPEDSPDKRIMRCTDELLKLSRQLESGPSFYKYYQNKTLKKVMKLFEEQENFVIQHLMKIKQNLATIKKPNAEKGIMEKLLEIDERIAIVMSCDMLLAGVDTTSGGLTASLFFLALNQSEQEKLREELTSGGDSTKYLKACIKEALRILPVVSANLRTLTKEYNVHGYRIPKNTVILINHQVMCRMDSQYPKPNEYIPERWLEDGPLSHKNAHPFAYSPFGFGARACIGKRIAEMEIEALLTKMIKNFKIGWTGPLPDLDVQSLIFYKGPYDFTFKDL